VGARERCFDIGDVLSGEKNPEGTESNPLALIDKRAGKSTAQGGRVG